MLILLALACSPSPAHHAGRVVDLDARRDPSLPSPTEHVLTDDAEKRGNKARKAWFKERHRAPPDVDWEIVERDNGLRIREARRALRERRPIDDTPSRWVERGSDNQAGRMHLARLSADGERLYAGSALGGLWRGTPEGDDWTPLSDDVYGGVALLAVFPPETSTGPDVILMGTSWGSVSRSTDGGATWVTPADMTSISNFRRLRVASDGSHVAWAVWQQDSAYGLYRSEDAGASWTKVHNFYDFGGDVWIERDGGSGVWVLDDGRVLHSADGGPTLVEVGAAPTVGGSAELTGSEAGAPRLWAMIDSTVFRSDDAGVTWAPMQTATDYWGTIGSSIVDPDVFVWAGVEVHRTVDGGASFDVQNAWWDYYNAPADFLHADVWSADVVPDGEGGEVWYIGTDGGLFRSRDTLATTQNLSLRGLRVSQYYGTHTSSANLSHVAAGSQDQGYQRSGERGDGVYDFDQLLSGDYAHLTSTDGSHDYVFSVYPGFILVQVGEDAPYLDYIDYPAGVGNAAWLPPIVADADSEMDFFFPAEKIYRYTARRGTWQAEVWSEQSFSQDGWEYVGALEFSPTNPQKAWVVTSYGRLFYSDDHGVTWDRSPDTGPGGQYFYGTALLASSKREDTVYVGGSGYGNPAVYRSTDGGRRWSAWGEGLPDTLVYALGEAPDGTMYAGTETSVYARGPDDTVWEDITVGEAPVTIYWSVETLADGSAMRFGTYGRGVWDYRLDVCDGTTDVDGDGAVCDVDCDDDDAARAPGLDDVCGDGIDQDCDGSDASCDTDDPSDTDDTDDTDVTDDGGDDGDPAKDEAGTCGCATGVSGSWLVALAGAALISRRRKPGALAGCRR